MPSRQIPMSSFEHMERLVDGLLGPHGRGFPRSDRQIPVDAVQRDDALHLYFDLPGIADVVSPAPERHPRA